MKLCCSRGVTLIFVASEHLVEPHGKVPETSTIVRLDGSAWGTSVMTVWNVASRTGSTLIMICRRPSGGAGMVGAHCEGATLSNANPTDAPPLTADFSTVNIPESTSPCV